MNAEERGSSGTSGWSSCSPGRPQDCRRMGASTGKMYKSLAFTLAPIVRCEFSSRRQMFERVCLSSLALLALCLSLPMPAAHAQWGSQSTCPDPGVCFISQAAKRAWEESNKCTFEPNQDKCDAAVAKVENSTPQRSHPAYGFYRNQRCIAAAACNNRDQLDDPVWLEDVVDDFITPLVNKEGDWGAIIQQCESMLVPPAGLRCQNLMAEYHISVDLIGSLEENGCGTERDWDLIGEWLKSCIEAGIREDLPIGSDIGGWYAKLVIASERQGVRDACLSG